jgi:hypothetical protein
MSKILLSIVVLGGLLTATSLPAQANHNDNNNSSSSSSNSTTVINTTNNNTVINNRYGKGRNYNRYNNRYGYKRPVYHAPSNQIQFRVPVRLNVFGSNIDLNIDSQGYGGYYRH